MQLIAINLCSYLREWPRLTSSLSCWSTLPLWSSSMRRCSDRIASRPCLSVSHFSSFSGHSGTDKRLKSVGSQTIKATAKGTVLGLFIEQPILHLNLRFDFFPQSILKVSVSVCVCVCGGGGDMKYSRRNMVSKT